MSNNTKLGHTIRTVDDLRIEPGDRPELLRIAQGLHAAYCAHVLVGAELDPKWETLKLDERVRWLSMAMHLLRMLRTPTRRMMEASGLLPLLGAERAVNVWASMIHSLVSNNVHPPELHAYNVPRIPENIEAVARAINGPREPTPETSPYSLDQLRRLKWERLTTQEKGELLWAARAAIEACDALATQSRR